ncbi:hypothetical protein A2533_02410 [Candidatus Falkowbacteria bacterium RIFOXYD2_FULL_35_9]|uniref:Uncharacterized protein n=1 Tax=Candidatus Falkowbacteria bacterium RIFOXYC2_FULL_36_12 TaxID=1798002 RepID=A0A1F5SWI2_9BACT|nr:MAG: hypothetical protein A2478_00985 [Candidatus Falkowbacteria bacterium RIFOXYC2_FULL_36_12]OGF31301.1 MAG: hypothetical protein A2300_00775 [Candidatus Falkowbacteria bacterium RIFOXYB2_FULL_35_7]OGF34427.1 MAG: hypothetical protein A2223_02785 [Candidatus Falkowbacteria bacterium RIFOXYA2_FULL_35_8]OGF45649.1 MAG: hypothetical protein A2533_02410 [Candidatus Falkowbacteria bacterium RIFOXYD2_FULL_35_9]
MNYPIKPHHIFIGFEDSELHFRNAEELETIGSREPAIFVALLKMAQSRDNWSPFTCEDFQPFIDNNRYDTLAKIRIELDWFTSDDLAWLGRTEDGKYRFTHEFVSTCFKISPAPDCIVQSEQQEQ